MASQSARVRPGRWQHGYGTGTGAAMRIRCTPPRSATTSKAERQAGNGDAQGRHPPLGNAARDVTSPGRYRPYPAQPARHSATTNVPPRTVLAARHNCTDLAFRTTVLHI